MLHNYTVYHTRVTSYMQHVLPLNTPKNSTTTIILHSIIIEPSFLLYLAVSLFDESNVEMSRFIARSYGNYAIFHIITFHDS